MWGKISIFSFGGNVVEEESGEKKKWISVKINEEAYILMRKLSALLGMKNYEIIFICLAFVYSLIRGDVEDAKKIVGRLRERVERQKWIVDNIMRSLDEILEK